MTIHNHLPATVEGNYIAITNSSTRYKKFVETNVPPDINRQDAIIVVNMVLNYTNFRLARIDWNKIIRCCEPKRNGRITQLVLFDFDRTSYKVSNEDSYDLSSTIKNPLFLSRLDNLEKLELRHCCSLPLSDLRTMKTLKWLNICIATEDNFRIPDNRNWYPPNMTTFMVHGYKVNGDPLDAIIAASIVMEIPPLDDGNPWEIKDILQLNGIGPFVKYDRRTGRIYGLNLSGSINDDSRRIVSLHLPSMVGRLVMLTKLFLYNICSVPKEITNLVHLKVLRLDNCSELFDPEIELPSVKDLQIRHSCTYELLSWITTCFSGLQSLEILGIDTDEAYNVLRALGGCSQDPKIVTTTRPCYTKNLTKLHISLAVPGDYIQGLEDALFGILRIHPNLSKLYVERVGGIEEEEENDDNDGDDDGHDDFLESLMVKILQQYPTLRRLSIGGPNIISLDRHQRFNSSFSDRCAILLNQNHCGRVLLNQGTCSSSNVMSRSNNFTATSDSTVEPSHYYKSDNCRQLIPVSLWPRVLERAQKISYFGKVLTKKDNTVQKVSAIYYLLRHGPALAMRKEFGFVFLKKRSIHASSSVGSNNDTISKTSKKKKRQGLRKRKQRSFD